MFGTVGHFLLWSVGLAGAETQTSPAEQEALARHAAGRRRCVEIGVWHGVNTRRIRTAMDPAGTLTGVDPFPPGRLGFSIPRIIALSESMRSSNGTLRLVRKTSHEAAIRWSAPLDFVFIDGDHTYDGLRTDWNAWRPHVVIGGIVCLHDSHPTPARPIQDAGSVRFTDEVILPDPRYQVVEIVETLTVLRRRE